MIFHTMQCIVQCSVVMQTMDFCGYGASGWVGDQENSSLLADEFVKQNPFLPKQKWPLLKLFPTNRKAYGLLYIFLLHGKLFFCWILPFFPLWWLCISTHILLPSVLGLFQFSYHPQDAQHSRASFSILVVGTHGHREETTGFGPLPRAI